MAGEEVTDIEEAAIVVDAFGNLKYIINGKTVGRDDFNAVTQYRIANYLAMLQEKYAPMPEEALPGAPDGGGLGIFGG